MFNLLIEREMDNFSVIEARDVLCDGGEPFSSKEKARKYIYKQLLSYEKKGWLSVLGARRDKRYQITNDFKLLTTKPKPLKTRKAESDFTTFQASDASITVLEKEKKQHEGELAITLGEIEEYKSLLMRFPNSKQDMLPLFNGARERSAKLLGRINALTNWIKVIQGNDQEC